MEINNQFIKAHAPIVRTIARQYRIPNVSMRDLMQEGYIGLIEAAKRYDPNTGVKFDSYASWWVRKYILEALRLYGNIIRIPRKEPTTRTEMAKRLGMNVGAVNKAYQRALKKCKKNVPK